MEARDLAIGGWPSCRPGQLNGRLGRRSCGLSGSRENQFTVSCTLALPLVAAGDVGMVTVYVPAGVPVGVPPPPLLLLDELPLPQAPSKISMPARRVKPSAARTPERTGTGPRPKERRRRKKTNTDAAERRLFGV
jgi:hypothetical protein